VLDSAVRQGLRYGIKPDSLRRFFSLQIKAAKEIQFYWVEQWKLHPERKPVEIPDLVTRIRPALIELGNQIIEELAQNGHAPININPVEGLSHRTASELAEIAAQIETYPDRFSQIIDTGELRVGTTGDYEPFSLKSGGIYRGIDIDLARDLARSLEVEVTFISTTWPTIMSDLQRGTFDIGMSGISRTLKRQRHAFFSIPYHEGGKTPIVRCSDKAALNSLERIDQKDVRIIVNPGGTNYQYAFSTFKHASLRIHNDNRTIFRQIIDGSADVMITDDIEVQLQTARHSTLCAAMPGSNLTYSQKGYLLPQDIILLQYVNQWLSQRLGDGTIARTFKQHLASP